jgi:hypothetical protein
MHDVDQLWLTHIALNRVASLPGLLPKQPNSHEQTMLMLKQESFALRWALPG